MCDRNNMMGLHEAREKQLLEWDSTLRRREEAILRKELDSSQSKKRSVGTCISGQLSFSTQQGEKSGRSVCRSGRGVDSEKATGDGLDSISLALEPILSLTEPEVTCHSLHDDVGVHSSTSHGGTKELVIVDKRQRHPPNLVSYSFNGKEDANKENSIERDMSAPLKQSKKVCGGVLKPSRSHLNRRLVKHIDLSTVNCNMVGMETPSGAKDHLESFETPDGLALPPPVPRVAWNSPLADMSPAVTNVFMTDTSDFSTQRPSDMVTDSPSLVAPEIIDTAPITEVHLITTPPLPLSTIT